VTRAHDAAVLARIREIPALSEVVFDGDVEGRPQRYVNVHSNRGIGRADRLAGLGRRTRKTYWVHSVGASKAQADAVAERVIAKLSDWKPDVEGFACERLRHESSQPTQKDVTDKPPIYYAVDVFDLYTEPIDPTPY
jgi:hypothetical protein